MGAPKYMKQIGIYDPYLSILGGAERYCGAIAECLKSEGQVILYGANGEILSNMRNKFGLKLDAIIGKPWPKNRVERRRQLRGLDYFFYITDGSLFFSPARLSFFMWPFAFSTTEPWPKSPLSFLFFSPSPPFGSSPCRLAYRLAM